MSPSDVSAPRIDPALINRLLEAGPELPEDLRAAFIALGSESVPALITLLQDESLDEDEDEDEDESLDEDEEWARVHAATLLGDIGDAAAVDPLLRLLDSFDPDDPLAEAVSLALPRFGAALVEPALALLAEGSDCVATEEVRAVLGECGVRDERIFAQLKVLFEEDPGLGAVVFANYGDARALPLVEEAIRSGELDADPRLALCELDDLKESHRKLGGEMTQELEAVATERYQVLQEAVANGDFPEDDLDEGGDDGDLDYAVLRQLERHPARPWIRSATCAVPECDCRHARLLVARRAEDIEAAMPGLQNAWDDESASPAVSPELLRAVTAFEVDIDSGAIDLAPWMGTDQAAAENAPFSASDLVDGKLLDELHDQWLEGKGFEPATIGPNPEVLDKLSSWKSGELIPYHLAFGQARLDYYEIDDVPYVLVDHHCPDPACPCGEVTIEWQRLGDRVEPVGEATWAPNRPPQFEGKRKALLQELWARFVARYPDFASRFESRSRQMQEVGVELVARAKARRKKAPARPWVSTSKKGRTGASRSGKKPRR